MIVFRVCIVNIYVKSLWFDIFVKKFPHQMETTGSSSNYIYLVASLLKMNNSLKGKIFAPKGSEFFPLRAVPHGMESPCFYIR